MKVLLDRNVILDVLLNRAPWVTDSAAIWDAHRAGELVAHVAAFAVPTVSPAGTAYSPNFGPVSAGE